MHLDVLAGDPKESNVQKTLFSPELGAMSYELRADETLGDGVLRVVCRQIQNAIAASKAKQNGGESPVHETRKHLKKARAALRLMRGEIARDLWKREDLCLGKVGRLISDVRDAEVRLQTVRDLRELACGKKRTFQETEELLAFELDSFRAAFSEWPRQAERLLCQILARIRAWPLGDLRCERLRKNVQRSYKLGRRRLKKASGKPTAEKLHAFRKREKELWYQLRLLQPLAPAVFKELNQELKMIGKYLGQVHDLSFVGRRLSAIGPGRARRRILNALIESKSDELRSAAIALGERFYAEQPREFGSRISHCFSDWETFRRRSLATTASPARGRSRANRSRAG